MYVLDHALQHTSTPCVSVACVNASHSCVAVPKVLGTPTCLPDRQPVILADSCGLMLTVKGMFVL